VKLVFVPTNLNVADIFTKPLDQGVFTRHREKVLQGFNGSPVLSHESTQLAERCHVVDHITEENGFVVEDSAF